LTPGQKYFASPPVR